MAIAHLYPPDGNTPGVSQNHTLTTANAKLSWRICWTSHIYKVAQKESHYTFNR